MNITFCNQKGGAGKTTLSFLMAHALASAGLSVGIADLDPQQTASRALTVLGEQELTKVRRLGAITEGADLDVVFVDTAPRLDDVLAKALTVSDRVILVSSPSPADLWSTQESRDFVDLHSDKDAKRAILFNSVVKGAQVSRQLGELAEAIGFKALNTQLPRRMAYQYAFLQGWSALRPADREIVAQAALEVYNL